MDVKNKRRIKNSKIRSIPFLGLVMLFTLGYMYINQLAEKKMRNIKVLSKDIKEMKAEYLEIQKSIMYGSTQSEVQKKVDSELKLNKEVPKKIIIGKS